MHFWPSGQFWTHWSHSSLAPPPSGGMMKPAESLLVLDGSKPVLVEVTTGSSPGPLVGLGVAEVEVEVVVVPGADVVPSVSLPGPSISVALVSESKGRAVQPIKLSHARTRHVPRDMFERHVLKDMSSGRSQEA
ncbi:hypothetical protein OV079_32585 [Nannocystis pusilla]|uniref:Uncharacterized protein n=1 Tax=Nannocystis pusilla TaxID=889268 RepID=A0A9X3EVJ3_9BACT|nr:hypothetical protein [Nannocystis pusilla]MCY1010224.1 hypothetical protein [Nannocystis pusilla]